MKSKAKLMTGALASLALIAIAALPSLINVEALKPQLESYLESRIGRPVHIGGISASLLAGGLHARDVSIEDDPNYQAGALVQARSVKIGVNWMALLFSRSLRISSLTLEEPQLTLVQSKSGKWNFSTLGGEDQPSAAGEDFPASQREAFVSASPAADVFFETFKISNGTVVLRNAGGEQRLSNIDLKAKNISLSSEIAFELSARNMDGGDIKMAGVAGPANRSDLARTPFHAALKIAGARLEHMQAVDSSSGLGGALSLQASLASNGNDLRTDGKGRAERLRLVRGGPAAAQPISFHYVTDYSLSRQLGILRSGTIATGRTTARLSGTYGMRDDRMNLHLKLSGSQMSLRDIAGVLPAFGVALPSGSKFQGGTVNANLALDGPVDRLVTSGDVQMEHARYAGFDLGSKLQSIPGLSRVGSSSDLMIVSLNTQFRVAPEGTQVSKLTSDINGIGSLAGTGIIGPDNQLNFHMAAAIAKEGVVGGILSHIGLKSIPGEIPFRVEGTTNNPRFVPDYAGLRKNLAELLSSNSSSAGNGISSEAVQAKKAVQEKQAQAKKAAAAQAKKAAAAQAKKAAQSKQVEQAKKPAKIRPVQAGNVPAKPLPSSISQVGRMVTGQAPAEPSANRRQSGQTEHHGLGGFAHHLGGLFHGKSHQQNQPQSQAMARR
jgi:AsmA protein